MIENWSPSDDPALANSVLTTLDGVCKELGLEYCLYAGTCLGLYRDGTYTEDNDVDICVVATEEEYRNLWSKLAHLKDWSNASGLRKGRIQLDLHPIGPEPPYIIPTWRPKPFIFTEFDTLIYNDMHLLMPSPIEEYLTWAFTEDWATPVSREEWLKTVVLMGSTIDLSDMKILAKYITSLPNNAVLVDIGTYGGGSALALAMTMPEGGHIWTIDCGEAQLYGFGDFHRASDKDRQGMAKKLAQVREEYKKELVARFTMLSCQDKITFLFGSSHPHEYLPMAKWPADRQVDLLLVDGDHYYSSVMADMLRWMPKVKAGGYAMFHDYEGWDVAMAAYHYLEQYPEWKELEKTETMLFCKKEPAE